MLPGKRGLLGRGSLFAAAGILVPLVYLRVAGGPDHAQHADAMAPATSTQLSQRDPDNLGGRVGGGSRPQKSPEPPAVSNARSARPRAHRR